MNLWARFLFFIFVICGALALHEDQIGKFDWKKSYVGKVKYSHIDLNSKSQPKLYVGTENNVVAALDIRDGSLLWRKFLEADEYGVINAFSVGSEITTVSGNGPYLVRGWNLNSGILSYEWSIPSTDSDVQWTFGVKELFLVKFHPKSLDVTSYSLKTGTPSDFTINASWLDPLSKCLLDDGTVFCTSLDGTVVAYQLSSNLLLSFSVLSGKPVSLAQLPSQYPSVLLTTSTGKHIALIIYENTLLSLEVPDKATAAVRESSEGPVLIQAVYANGVYEMSATVFNTKHSLQLKKIVSNTGLPLSSINSFACTSKVVDLSCYTALVGEDDSLILVDKAGKVSWVREEALANIVSVEMVDLPVSDEEAAIEKEFGDKEGGILGMLMRRVQSQFTQIVNVFVTVLGLKEHCSESSADLVKDPFGLNKLIIAVTKASKVYGIKNDKGEIIWKQHLKNVRPFSALGSEYIPLFVQRTSRHLPHPAICTLLFKQKESGNSALYTFNPITGQPLYGGLNTYDFKVKQTLLLPKENEEFIKGLLLVSETGSVEAFPPKSIQEALKIYKDLFVYSADSETGNMIGYAFYKTKENLQTTSIWNINLNAPIVNIAQKNKAEKVHSQGRVLGDRSVMYKYINPHLMAVATHTIDPVHKNIISIYLIDSVSGVILFSTIHKRAILPVHIVNSENWVVYSFFNDKFRRTEVVSLDLYEGKSMRNSTEFSSFTDFVEPLIERQAYIFPHNVMALMQTITEKGITNKHVLVGVSTGSVLEIPWALLDPHRSTEVREEGVIPYTPDLSLPQEATLTYNHSLPLITGIHTSPSGLESTSLVLVYGLDLFYTRVSPSKTFDVLKEDFEYWLITAVLAGLISAAYVTKKLASRKALKQAWK